jgi:adenylosuccinate synthase
VINVSRILTEIADCKLDIDRLTIDPHAMIIDKRDEAEERKKGGLVDRIGSTGQGVGAATIRRIRDRYASVVLAKDVPALAPFVSSSVDFLWRAYVSRWRVLLEGTQGTALSLYHGSYPHVTSRDTTVSGILSEAGIPPGRVRKVIMTSRTFPIRVQSPKGHTSGPMSQPIAWSEVSRRSGISVRSLRKVERTSTTNRRRRVAEFDWDLLLRAAVLNRPTDIALTFVDYLQRQNVDARRFEQLTEDTLRFIEEVERVAQAPVSLISTRFHPRCIIDRRNW